MNILHINSSDRGGGAAGQMYRLHQELIRQGHKSQLLVAQQMIDETGISHISGVARPNRNLKNKILDRFGAVLEKLWGIDNFSYQNSWSLQKTSLFLDADVINLHNIHGGGSYKYFNFRALPWLARKKPLVWKLADMWAITGHCAFSYECQRWRDGCFNCPLLEEKNIHMVEPKPTPRDFTRQIWESKRRIYQSTPLHIITPSRWLLHLVRDSILGSCASLQCIPNGVDTEVFHPLEAETARKALDIPIHDPVIFFSSIGVQHYRKGVEYLVQALGKFIRNFKLTLLTSGYDNLEITNKNIDLRNLGFLSNQRLQRLAYTASDLFVLPTLADNLPNVIIEAMACGTPVVAFNTGGVPEIVNHMETGYLARLKDIDDLAFGIHSLLADKDFRQRMGNHCREVVKQEFSIELQCKRYLEVYQHALDYYEANQ